MELTRRGFLGSMIGGLALIGTLSISVGEDFDPHQDYVAAPGLWNIWRVENNEWKLMTDSRNHPLEFSSEGDAEDFQKEHSLLKHRYASHIPDDRNGLTIVRSVPIELHPKDFYNRSEIEAEQLIDDWNLVSDFHRDLARRLLMAKNGAKQSRIWIASFETSENKKLVMQLQHSKGFAKMIRDCYCHSSYQSQLAKLEAFCAPMLVA